MKRGRKRNSLNLCFLKITADDAQELTDDMIGRLVEVVKIYEDCRMEVVLNYSDDRDRLATLLKEMEADHGNC